MIGVDVFEAFVMSARIVRSTPRRRVSFARIAVLRSWRRRDNVGEGGDDVDGAVDAQRNWQRAQMFVRGAVDARADSSRKKGDRDTILPEYELDVYFEVSEMSSRCVWWAVESQWLTIFDGTCVKLTNVHDGLALASVSCLGL